MRSSLLAILFAACALSAHALTIKHTEVRRMQSVSFTRFSELLGCKNAAQDPTRVVLFSDSKSHDGIFFQADLDTRISKIPASSVALLETVFQGDVTPRQNRFEIPATKNTSRALYLGLTDAEFAQESQAPHLMAWKISILDKDGNVLSSSASPLWER